MWVHAMARPLDGHPSTGSSPVEKPAGFRFQTDRFSAKQPFLVDLAVVFLCFSG